MSGIKNFLRKIKNKFVVEKIIPVNTPVLEGKFLEGHTAFVSGGSGGIGYAIAERFAANGCQVIISGTNVEKLVNTCDKLGSNVRWIALDITRPEDFAEKLAEADNILQDNQKIDILVNCAGKHGPSNLWDVTVADWDQVFDVNLRGAYFLAQAFARYYRENGIKGHILNISSASALKPGKTPYEISKCGVASMTEGLATELIKYGIVVNALAPGPTATSMISMDGNSSLKWSGNPSGRVATPEEIANWAVLMVSDIGNYVVGDSFYVTGGSGTICIDK